MAFFIPCTFSNRASVVKSKNKQVPLCDVFLLSFKVINLIGGGEGKGRVWVSWKERKEWKDGKEGKISREVEMDFGVKTVFLNLHIFMQFA